MNGYLAGIQRGFSFHWVYDINIFEGPIFNCAKDGLVLVIDNKFSVQQASGLVTTSHNTLSKEDLEILFSSEFLSRASPLGFHARLIFGIALVTAMRPSALATLSTSQFRKIKLDGQSVWTLRGVIESRVGASKVNRGGRNAVRDKPTEICIWNKEYLDGKLNLYKDLDDYMAARATLECGTDRFLAADPKGKILASCFKRQHLGRNSFSRIIKEVCEACGVTGSGLAEGMTAHGLRGKVATLLFEDGKGDASVALRTGHRDLRSLKSYHNLRGSLGKKQQESIFGGASKKQKLEVTPSRLEGKENFEGAGDLEKQDKETQKRTNLTGLKVDGLLAGVAAISGGNVTFNVHNHYR